MRGGMGPIFLLAVGILVALTTLCPASAAPATYDQRQDGRTNVDARVNNLLLVLSLPVGPQDLLTTLAVQALDIPAVYSAPKGRTAVQTEEGKEQTAEPVVYETDEAHVGREPYHVEIVHIDKEGESAPEKLPELKSESSGEIKQEKSSEKSLEAIGENLGEEKDALPDAPVDEAKSEKKSRSLWSSEGRELDGTLEKQSDLVATVGAAASGYQTETLEETKHELAKSGKPGLSMKKQLSKKEQESMYLSLHKKTDVPSHEGKLEELKLLGDAIENCGPDRYRDDSGICQEDKNFSAK